MTATAAIDTVCTFFGGPYDAFTRTYRTPTVAGVGIVRRAWAREDDFAEYTHGMAPGTATGCVIVAQIHDIHDSRVALPGIQGRRKVRYGITLHCFVWSVAPLVEDCQDAVYALRDAITAKMRTDPTMGSGGIENGGFQFGEGLDGDVSAHIEQGGNLDGATKAYLSIDFEAHAYDVG